MCGGRMKAPVSYVLRINLQSEKSFWDPGLARLLHQINALSSMRAAAQSMGMSYTKAWRIIRRAEQELSFALVESSTGGERGGGSRLTEKAQKLLRAYDAMQEDCDAFLKERFQQFFLELEERGQSF